MIVKQALWSLVFLFLAGWLMHPSLISAATSDDDTGNYVRRDPEDYNFLPLVLDPGSSTGNTGTLRDTISFNMVYDQGYEVQCAKPQWYITPQVFGAIKEYFELYSDPVLLSGPASYNIDFSQGTIPLYRGDEDLLDTQKNSSFEGYFGANYLKDSPPKLNSSGVTNLLLNQDGQCVVKYANLDSLFGVDGGLCSKLKDPDQCALDREIDGTSYTTETLYNALTELFSITNDDGTKNVTCADITGQWRPELEQEFDITPEQFNNEITPAVDALRRMPFNLDVLYRLAFLVISPQQNPTNDGGVFSFLQTQAPQPVPSSTIVDDDTHAPIVIGFKVPFLATNSLFSLPALRDSALVTALSMRTIESLQREQATVLEERTDFIEKIIANKQTKPVINCDGMPQCTGNGDSQQLFAALIDIINGSEQTCSGFKGPYENAGDLGSPAAASEEKEFQKPYFSEVLPQVNSAGFEWTLLVADPNVQSIASQEKVPVTAHLITPYGSNLEYITQTLQSYFDNEQFQKIVENNCIEDFNGECGLMPEYFTFSGITADLDSEADSYSFVTNPEECEEIEDQAEKEQCQTKSFGANLTEQPREPLRIIGAQLGWMIWKLQQDIRGIGSKAYEYIKECKRTEDLFLGRCIGYQGQPGGSDSEAANSCNDYQGITVDLPTMPELEQKVCSIARGNDLDAQLLWGMMQVDGSPFLRQILAGETSMSCGDLITNSCGASQIVGIIVPQCIDPVACPQAAAWALDEGPAGQQYREEITPEVACSVDGSLTYILQKRKSEIAFLKAEYQKANGSEPSTKQIYYMMAGRNYGLPVETLVKPACEGAPPVQGCGGANYCQCVMDTFPFSCP
ncbi:MAG TPA: hypothetical protein DIV47_00795 [Candidatus Pacebacteria bacterium]|nr:hypothetical protein [Candidatus Paceibacterota bacterium]